MSVKPMLAKDADLEKVKFPLIVQPKLDGIRAMVIEGELRSRTLKLIPNAEIQEALGRPEFEGLDGELILGDPTAEDCYRKTSSYVMSQSKTGGEWSFHVFDKWNRVGGYTPAENVVTEAHSGNVHADTLKRLVAVPSQTVADHAQLALIEQAFIAEGHEGVIARVPSADYKFGRSGKTGPLLKIKRFIDFEAEIVGVYEEMHNANESFQNELGRTARSTAKDGLVGKGRLGGFYLRAINGPHEGDEFKCGTGFDAAQRVTLWSWAQGSFEEAWDTPLVGKAVKIKSFPIGVKDKPRHPVFLGFRDMEVDG